MTDTPKDCPYSGINIGDLWFGWPDKDRPSHIWTGSLWEPLPDSIPLNDPTAMPVTLMAVPDTFSKGTWTVNADVEGVAYVRADSAIHMAKRVLELTATVKGNARALDALYNLVTGSVNWQANERGFYYIESEGQRIERTPLGNGYDNLAIRVSRKDEDGLVELSSFSLNCPIGFTDTIALCLMAKLTAEGVAYAKRE